VGKTGPTGLKRQDSHKEMIKTAVRRQTGPSLKRRTIQIQESHEHKTGQSLNSNLEDRQERQNGQKKVILTAGRR